MHRQGSHHGWHGVNHFVGARLHRRLFVSMGLAIFLTLLVVAVLLHTVLPPTGWQERTRAFSEFAARRFSEVWHDAPRRNQLADEAADAFGVVLHLKDTTGGLLYEAGGSCEKAWQDLVVPAVSTSGEMGHVLVCSKPGLHGPGIGFWVFVLIAASSLWIVSGCIARHLGRPLWRLVEVTRQLGSGDLTARARLGRHHVGEVGILAHSIDDMAARIENQLKAQRELLAVVSHEIRTPLARLRVLTEMLRDQSANERLLREAEREVAEIDDLTGQLLASSRLDFVGITARPLDAVELSLESLRRLGLDESLLQVADDTDTRMSGDPTLIGRALTNLLGNACTHGKQVVSLRLQDDGARLAFIVRDAGPGLAPGDEDKVFEPFVLGQNGSSDAPSLGLGLHLVKRIAEAHGGRAWAENHAQGGALVGFSCARA
jgi:two-component system, OmpR family, sensor kinase